MKNGNDIKNAAEFLLKEYGRLPNPVDRPEEDDEPDNQPPFYHAILNHMDELTDMRGAVKELLENGYDAKDISRFVSVCVDYVQGDFEREGRDSLR